MTIEFDGQNNKLGTTTANSVTIKTNDTDALIVDSSQNVGIGTSSPDGKLHIISDSAGTVTASNLGNDLVVEGTGATGISILAPNDQNANIIFGDPDDNDTAAIQYKHSDDSFRFFLNGTSEKMQINSSGNVGIGTTSPANKLEVSGAIVSRGAVDSYTNDGLYLSNEGSSIFKIGAWRSGANASILTFGTDSGSDAAPVERMRIDSSGNVLVGTTNTTGIPTGNSTNVGAYISSTGIYVNQINNESNIYLSKASGYGYSGFVRFFVTGIERGSITTNGSSVSYNTTSDYRLKENVVDLTSATNRLKQLQPKRFNFIADADTTVDGFLAHEVSSVVPEAINGTYNEVEVWKEGEELPEGVSVGDNKLDDEGNTIPKYQGIDQSKLVPLLTASLQEAIAKIEELETRLEALENE